MLRYLGVVAIALVGVAGADTPRPAARLVGKPPTLVVGRAWTATVRLTGTARTPAVVARMGARASRFPVRRVRNGVYRAVVRLAIAGSWRLWLQVGPRRLPLATVRVVPVTLGLDQPAQLLVAQDGSLLVAERGLRDRIVRVDPATGVVRTFASGLSDPYGLALAPDGSILVAAGAAVHRVPAAGGRPVEVVRVDASPIALAPGGDLYFANRAELGVIRAGSRRPELLPVEVRDPHALVLEGDSLFVADTGNGRILRVELPGGQASVVAGGLRAPLGLVSDGTGGLLAAEYATGTLLRVSRSGERQQVASGLVRPYALAAAGGSTYVVEAGETTRPSGGVKRVLADGSVVPLPLRRP